MVLVVGGIWYNAGDWTPGFTGDPALHHVAQTILDDHEASTFLSEVRG